MTRNVKFWTDAQPVPGLFSPAVTTLDSGFDGALRYDEKCEVLDGPKPVYTTERLNKAKLSGITENQFQPLIYPKAAGQNILLIGPVNTQQST